MPQRFKQNLKLKSLIIDSFPFFQEIELLKVRLEYLGESVDRFLISESNIDFAANKKPYYLTNKIISGLPFSDKITVVRSKFSDFEINFIYKFSKKLKWRKPLWKIQLKQRNILQKEISKISPNGILLFGDLDEFPNANEIRACVSALQKNPDKIYTLNQLPLVYNLSTQSRNEDWPGTVVCNLGKAQSLTPNKLRKRRSLEKAIGGGWHFSYFGDSIQIQKKVVSLAPSEKHFEFQNTCKSDVEKLLSKNRDPFNVSKVRRGHISVENYPDDLIKAFKKHMPRAIQFV